MQPYLIERKCPAIRDMCKAIAACPRKAILYVEDRSAPLGGRILFERDKCDGCGLCATVCCGDAVEMR